MFELSTIVAVGYLIGSIPTSLILSKLRHGIDIRDHGSGNAGGTNVARILGWKAGLIVITLDVFKGYIAAMLLPKLISGPFPFNNTTSFEDITIIQMIVGTSAILGHIWTAFGGFRGGKGIATAGGVLIGLATIELFVSIVIFALIFVLFRYVSLSSISAAVALPVTMFYRHNIFHAELQGYHTLIFFSIGITILLLYTHRENIKRLIAGTEHRLTSSQLFKKYSHKI
ncbi:MAG TPA: glycerol-3-phosphate 1-O-acyltransferase PlsY [Bacteroidota bacterium]|nr:glycerol-3-phosphate 1-O-acyltransferase PlsY [Bacteroidota bacterium]